MLGQGALEQEGSEDPEWEGGLAAVGQGFLVAVLSLVGDLQERSRQAAEQVVPMPVGDCWSLALEEHSAEAR